MATFAAAVGRALSARSPAPSVGQLARRDSLPEENLVSEDPSYIFLFDNDAE